MRGPWQVGFRVASVLVGALLGLASLTAHRHTWTLVDLDVPWGLALALIATYFAVRAAALLDGRAAGAVCCALGWLLMLLYLFSGRDEGDYLIAADWQGYGVLVGGLLAAGAGVLISIVRAGPDRDATESPQRIRSGRGSTR